MRALFPKDSETTAELNLGRFGRWEGSGCRQPAPLGLRWEGV